MSQALPNGSMRQGRIGVVSFTDPRPTAVAGIRESYIAERHRSLVAFLEGQGFEVVDPLPKFRREGEETAALNQTAETFHCAQLLKAAGIDALVIGCWHWTDPYLPVHLAIQTDVPIGLFCEDDPGWAGPVLVSSVSAALREVVHSRRAMVHRRFRGDRPALAAWAKGVCALQRMRRSSLLLWGGTYSLRMEHLRDDVSKLKSFLIGDVLSEDQYILIQKADALLAANSPRIDAFISWLEALGTRIVWDDRMLTAPALRRQVALYLGARERLTELEGEGVVGVSIKCQPEVMTYWGATACMLPSFLPFASDSEGPRPIVPTVCEGDIKGLLSCVLLHQIAPELPPMFGDVKYIGDDYWIISNCGGSSVFYAANSLDPAKALPGVTLSGQCHGASGAAVGYFSKPGPVTLARFARINGQYSLQLGRGEAMVIDPGIRSRIKFGQMWPLMVVKMPAGVDLKLFFEVVSANHYSAVPGDYVEEVEAACLEAGVAVTRVDSNEAMRQALAEIYR